MAPSKDIILYHYSYSPFARRVVWYLNLRSIPYSQCNQPPIMPRPDVASLGTPYRRIPLLVIGRDIYHDTRLIISKLEALFPASSKHPAISALSPDARAIEVLLERWIIDGGVFVRGGQLIPTSFPLMSDQKFTKDREQMSGRPWSKDAIERNRPEAIVEMRLAFELLEKTLLSDGRDWVLGGEGPTLSDIQAVWPLHWVQGMKGALPDALISSTQYPHVFSWIARFQSATSAAVKRNGKPKTLTGAEAVSKIGAANFAEGDFEVDAQDPSGLQKGQEVEFWPTDSGNANRDRGLLLGLSGAEIVIEGRTSEGKTVRIHAPRHGFRIRAAQQSSNL